MIGVDNPIIGCSLSKCMNYDTPECKWPDATECYKTTKNHGASIMKQAVVDVNNIIPIIK